MFDARSWARWIAAKRREETARCEREGRIRSLAEVNGQVREVKHWLVTGKGHMSEHLRSASKATVRRARRYGGEIRGVRQKAPPLEGGVSRSDPPSEFLLDADSEPPMLFVTEDMAAAARHTGPYVQGKVVDRREMMQLIRSGLRTSRDALRLLLEQGTDGSAEA